MDRKLRRYGGPECHLRQDVALQVDARCDFDQLQAALAEAEHGALGHVKRLLSPAQRDRATVRDVLHALYELAHAALFANDQSPALHLNLQSARVEGADEHDLPGTLADVDEAPRPREPGTELAHVKVAL